MGADNFHDIKIGYEDHKCQFTYDTTWEQRQHLSDIHIQKKK